MCLIKLYPCIMFQSKLQRFHQKDRFMNDEHIDVKGVQIFEGRTDNKISSKELAEPSIHLDQLGHPVAHLSALKHTTGEAIYVDDIPSRNGKMLKKS